jgi:hypothetical protein
VTETAYPLSWPAGWRRTGYRTRAAFGRKTVGQFGPSKESLSVAGGTDRCLEQLRMMGANRIVISSNLKLRQDGLPRSDQAQPADPGVAVYWKARNGEARCMAIDRYDRVQDNLAAIAATLDAMRAIDRHGGAAIMDRAFAGFKALAAPEQPWQVLGVKHDASADEIDAAWRKLAAEHHPDRGGDEQKMARINRARDALMNDA